MQSQNRVLREERGRVVEEMRRLTGDGVMNNDQKAAWGRLKGDLDRLNEKIELVERSDEAYQEARRSGAPPSGPVGVIGDLQKADEEYRKAFGRYLRYGLANISMSDAELVKSRRAGREVRDMSEGVGGGAYPGSTSGFFVPVGFIRQIEDALKYYGPMLNGGAKYPTIMSTATGQPLPWPTSNDTSVMGELVGEGQQVTMEDVVIGQITFGAWKLSSKLVRVSLELLEDSAFDLETFLISEFSKRIGRAVNSLATTGAGSGSQQPQGIVTAALASGPLTTAVGSYTNDGVGGANTIGSDDLTNLEHSVDPLYRPAASYMAHDSTIAALKRVKDKYGRPLWQPAFKDGEPDTVNGYPIISNPYLATLQTNSSSPQVTNTTMLFGPMEKFVIRRVKDLSVLRLSERFADFGQVGFLAFYRFDSQLLDAGTHPIGALQNIF